MDWNIIAMWIEKLSSNSLSQETVRDNTIILHFRALTASLGYNNKRGQKHIQFPEILPLSQSIHVTHVNTAYKPFLIATIHIYLLALYLNLASMPHSVRKTLCADDNPVIPTGIGTPARLAPIYWHKPQPNTSEADETCTKQLWAAAHKPQTRNSVFIYLRPSWTRKPITSDWSHFHATSRLYHGIRYLHIALDLV